MTGKWNRGRPIIGYTDTQTVKLDLDYLPFKTAKYLALKTMEKFHLGGFVILKSSEKHYHVVFNRTVSWAENISLVAWACLESGNWRLRNWFLLQCIKGSSTLRVSPKGGKPPPRVVFRYGKQDTEVQNFLRYRRRIKRILKEVQNERTGALERKGNGAD